MADDREGAEPPGLRELSPDLASGIVEQAPDGILIVDGDGRVAYANVRAGVIFGLPRSALVGVSVDDLVPISLAETHARHRASYGQELRVRAMGVGLEPHARRADGSEFPVAVTLSPIGLRPGLGTIALVRVGSDRAPPASSRVGARTNEREQLIAELQAIVGRLDNAGLVLQSVLQAAEPTVEEPVATALAELSLATRQRQAVAFELMSPPESDEDH